MNTFVSITRGNLEVRDKNYTVLEEMNIRRFGEAKFFFFFLYFLGRVTCPLWWYRENRVCQSAW